MMIAMMMMMMMMNKNKDAMEIVIARAMTKMIRPSNVPCQNSKSCSICWSGRMR